MKEFVLAVAAATILLILAIAGIYGTRSRRREDCLSVSLSKVPFAGLMLLLEELHQRRVPTAPRIPEEARPHRFMPDVALSAALHREAEIVENALNEVMAAHPRDVAQLNMTFAALLEQETSDNPYVAPTLFTRFDQTAAKARHHRRCYEVAAQRHSRNQRLLGHINLLRADIKEAKEHLLG
jgi:hypothetical protein